MKILLLDNYDSFTYNLCDYLRRCGAEVAVVRNDVAEAAELGHYGFDALVLSPGPGRPREAGMLMEAVRYWHTRVPILGVCLGHQAIGEFFGARLVHAQTPMHGKTSRLRCEADPIFADLSQPFEVGRYHSLVLEALPEALRCTAQTAEGECMALRHKELPIVGVQFHPESVLTPQGLGLLHNWLASIAP